ncbi:MAG: HNH endonuclease [Saprospiraceae bacterium]
MAKRRAISESLKAAVALRAYRRCEYCRVRQEYIEYPFHVDHIISLKHGGNSTLDN